LEAHHWRLLNQGFGRAMESWMKAIPAEWRLASPRTSLSFAWTHLLRGNFGQTAAFIQAAEAALAGLSPNESRSLQADLLALRANLAQTQGQIPEAIELARQSLALMEAEDHRLKGVALLALGAALRQSGSLAEADDTLQEAIRHSLLTEDHVTAMLAVAHLAMSALQTGRLHFLAEIAEQAIQRAEAAHTAPAMIGAVHIVLGTVYYEWDQVERARGLLLRGIHLAMISGHTASLAYGKLMLARLQQGSGELAEAGQNLAEVRELLTQGAPGWVRAEWAVRQASWLTAQGQLAEAETVLRQTGVDPEAPVSQQTVIILLAWLRWMIAGRRPEALALAERLVSAAEAGGQNGTLLQALVLGSKAGGGEIWLQRARQLAAIEGYQRIFLDEGLEPQSGRASEKIAPDQRLIEPLTEREQEVLRLLAEGLTYSQIAERLVVSLNTVRYHVKAIYGKLGVKKQVQAVERGRELGLL